MIQNTASRFGKFCIAHGQAIAMASIIEAQTPITQGIRVQGTTLVRFHDDEKGVTCWQPLTSITSLSSASAAIACLPDKDLLR